MQINNKLGWKIDGISRASSHLFCFLVMVQKLHFLIPSLLLQVAMLLLGSRAGWGAPASVPQLTRPAAVTITGNVLSDKGLPLPSVVVSVRGAATITTTNSAGNFLIAVEAINPVLVFTCAGYQAQALAVQARSGVAVTLYAVGAVTPSSVQPALGAGSNGVVFTEEIATFPGGETAYMAYLRQNAHYPEKAQQQGLAGTVFVSFVVDETGRILDAQVLKGSGDGFDEEALRLVRLMPWWNPGRVEGKPVRSGCTLRIRFGVQPQP